MPVSGSAQLHRVAADKPSQLRRLVAGPEVIQPAFRIEPTPGKLCCKSFLSLWSYPTPQAKDVNKELCDCLLVCDPDVIIFSVKDINLVDAGDAEVNWRRWQKRAIEESVDPLYGAARFVSRSSGVVTAEGKPGLSFPDMSRRRVHLVAVALGGMREGPANQGDFRNRRTPGIAASKAFTNSCASS